MSRTVYVNGSFVPEADAKISVFDRAFLFAEGVYEVTAVLGGKPLDLENHLARLDRSLAEMQIDPPLSHAALRALHAELIALNKVDEGVVYLEITRGVADRDFLYPEGVPPTVVAFTQSRPLLDNPYAETGIKVITLPDLRWKRRVQLERRQHFRNAYIAIKHQLQHQRRGRQNALSQQHDQQRR
jgi:D-alanine transaminase